MLNSYPVNAAYLNGSGGTGQQVIAFVTAGSQAIYGRLCRAFISVITRTGIVAGNNAGIVNPVNGSAVNWIVMNGGVAFSKEQKTILGIIALAVTAGIASLKRLVVIRPLQVVSAGLVRAPAKRILSIVTKSCTGFVNTIRGVRLIKLSVASDVLSVTRFVLVKVAVVIVGSIVNTPRKLIYRRVVTASNISLRVVRALSRYTNYATAIQVNVRRAVSRIWNVVSFSAAGNARELINLIGGAVVNMFAINGGIPPTIEQRTIWGKIVTAVSSATVNSVKRVLKPALAIGSNILKVVRRISLIERAISTEVGAVVRYVRVILVAAVSGVVTTTKAVRVFVAKVISSVAPKRVLFVAKKFNAVTNNTVSIFVRGVRRRLLATSSSLQSYSKRVGKPIITIATGLSSAFKLRVVLANVITIVRGTNFKRLWNYSSVSTAVKASRIRLAFLVGVRVLSQWIIGLFKSNTTYVCVNMSTIYVVDKYDPIVVPPEDTEIV